MPKKYQDEPTGGGRGGREVPQPVPAPTGEGNPPTLFDDMCSSGTLTSTITKPSNVTVSVRNGGDCTVKILLKQGNVDRGSTLVDKGKQETISGSMIDEVKLDCQAGTGDKPKCRFTYRIVWS